MADCVERGLAKRQGRAVRRRRPAISGNSIRNGALGGGLQTGERQVGKRDIAAAGLCQIKSGPAGAGADIKQAVARRQLQKPTDLVCLCLGGPTGGAAI